MRFETPLRTTRGTPRKITPWLIERCMEQFNRDGHYFSPSGHTMSAVLNYLDRNRIAYTLAFNPQWGYTVVRGWRSLV